MLVHPECRRPLQLVADKVGSTAALLEFARTDPAEEYIVVTESGILFEMQKGVFRQEVPARSGGGCRVPVQRVRVT